MREELEQRLSILIEGGLISPEAAGFCKQAAELLSGEDVDMSGEKAAMFLTHLAMATQRVIDGDREEPIGDEVLETVKAEPIYPRAVYISECIQKLWGREFPQAEKDFLKVHLCNVLS